MTSTPLAPRSMPMARAKSSDPDRAARTPLVVAGQAARPERLVAVAPPDHEEAVAPLHADLLAAVQEDHRLGADQLSRMEGIDHHAREVLARALGPHDLALPAQRADP